MNNVVLSTRHIDDLVSDIASEVIRRLDLYKKSEPPTAKEPADEKLTVPETAEFLGITVATVYTKKSKGELPACKAPGSKRVFFFKSDLVDYLKQGRVKTHFEIDREASAYLGKKSRLNNGK